MKLSRAVEALSALAQETRLQIFRLLVVAGEKGLTAGSIAEQLGIAPATLSFHLKELSHAGLVSGRAEGRFVIYSARFGVMAELLDFLGEDCCGGRPELCAPASKRVAVPATKRRTTA